MKVTFTRIRDRAYGVTVEGPKIERKEKSPAPGYDDRLPHDVAHFIVENELGILGGVFGQLAAGGTANTFFSPDSKTPKKDRRRGKQISKENKKDALFSEHAIWAAQSRWEKHDIIPDTKIPKEDLDRIILQFEEFAEVWSKTKVGESVILDWNPRTSRKRSR